MNLINTIYDALERPDREKKSHYMSEGLTCGRQLYYKWTKTEKTNITIGIWLLKLAICAEAPLLVRKHG